MENTPNTVKEVLIAALASIAPPEAWCQYMQGQTAEGEYRDPWNPLVVRRCALGAIYQFQHTPMRVRNDAAVELAKALPKALPFEDSSDSWGVAGYNNTHEHADVLALFQRAIDNVEEPPHAVL